MILLNDTFLTLSASYYDIKHIQRVCEMSVQNSKPKPSQKVYMTMSIKTLPTELLAIKTSYTKTVLL